MSDFSPLDRAKVAVHRSSFDLSSKKLFTAKVGEILPCYWQIAIPGSKYRISSDWFTRTVPVNTAAYTRIKEYYDFYAVPLRLISRALPQAFTQMTDYMTSAASNTANTEMLTSVPNATLQLISLSFQTINGKDVFDDAGLPYAPSKRVVKTGWVQCITCGLYRDGPFMLRNINGVEKLIKPRLVKARFRDNRKIINRFEYLSSSSHLAPKGDS